MDKNPQAYRHRSYRRRTLNNNFTYFSVSIEESDLFIGADSDFSALAQSETLRQRTFLKTYIQQYPNFLTTLVPWERCEPHVPPIVQSMISAGSLAGVGPMAAVAGAIAESVGRELRRQSQNVIVENGGDLYLDARQDLRVGIYTGRSAFKEGLVVAIREEEMPIGLCTSSGTVGHSLSFGRADSVSVKATGAALADAVATSLGNMVKSPDDITRVLARGMEIPGVSGVLIVIGHHLGAIGRMELEKS